jgi:hypothetical protein
MDEKVNRLSKYDKANGIKMQITHRSSLRKTKAHIETRSNFKEFIERKLKKALVVVKIVEK